jgi:Arc/MetJ-type ribon-helix-helix transcriptional regulator
MHLQLSKPELQKFVEDQVTAGHFRSPEEVLEEALLRMMEEEVDEETLAAIEEGDAQLDRGEGRPWEEVREELRAKYLGE